MFFERFDLLWTEKKLAKKIRVKQVFSCCLINKRTKREQEEVNLLHSFEFDDVKINYANFNHRHLFIDCEKLN
jgi:hypothetical protein